MLESTSLLTNTVSVHREKTLLGWSRIPLEVRHLLWANALRARKDNAKRFNADWPCHDRRSPR